MGNLCFGKKKPKPPHPHPTSQVNSSPHDLANPSNSLPTPKNPNQKIKQLDSPAPEEITTSNKRTPAQLDNAKNPRITPNDAKKKFSEKETNISKNDYSFAKVTRTGENKFSFEVYGEDISALNPKFLMENLGNISHTSKINISRNDLLLMTEENQEILKFLSANNITHKDLIQGMRREHAPGTIALDEKLRITATMIQNERDQYGLPEHLRLKYLKLVNQNATDPASQSNLSTINNMSANNPGSSMNNNDPNKNIIKDESWKQDMNIVEDQNKFLQVKQKFFLNFDIWDSDKHEIILRDLVKDINRSYNMEMRTLLRHYKTKTSPSNFPLTKPIPSSDPLITAFNHNRNARIKTLSDADAFTVMNEKPSINDLHKKSFLIEHQNRPNNFFTALSCIINSDVEFQTNSLRRLVYPHLNNFPCHSPENMYFVKLFINGIRRCVPLNGSFDQGLFYTNKKELYPLFIQKGLQKIYPKDDLTGVLPNYLLYRMIGWIPEILVFSDIGSCDQSYEKLKESFLSFSVMLSFDYNGDILPILEFVDGSNGRGMKIRTILPRKAGDSNFLNEQFIQIPGNQNPQSGSMTQTSSNKIEQSTSAAPRDITQLLDWRDLYNSNQLQNIYISWNPSIHSCRKMIHFNVTPQPISSKSIFDNSLFNNYKKVQILISLSPHNEPNETRLILEKHKVKQQGILYEIRYNLYAFNRHRILLPSECFKTLEVREDENNDVINDTMIFEQNNIQDNYILTIEAIPLGHLASVFPKDYKYQNPADDICKIRAPKQGKKFIDCDVDDFGVPERWPEEIVMSLNIFAWYETEIMEIPFKEVTQIFKMSLTELTDQKFKLKILKACDIEIRIEGGVQHKFAVKISKFSRYRNSYREGEGTDAGNTSQTKNVYLVQNNVPKRKANSLRFRAKEGTFLVNFGKTACGKKDNGYESDVEERLEALYQDQRQESVMITLLSYGQELHKTFKQSMNRIKNSTPYRNKTKLCKIESRHFQEEFFQFEMPQKGGLKFSKSMGWEWNAGNNFGDNKFGILTFQKFHQNPGFLVTVKEDCQIQAEVVVDLYRHEKCGYKLNIFEISDSYELENILDYDEYRREKKLTTDILFLSKNKNGYLFLLVAMYSEFLSPFTLTLQSDIEINSMKKNTGGICKLPWVERFSGAIEPRTGGWIKMHNFLLNQSFIIIVGDGISNETQQVFIELSSSNKTQHIGVSIIPLSSLKSLCHVEESEIESVNTNPAFLAEMNAFYLQIPQGTYMIIPTSFEPLEPGERLDYELKIFSSIGFKFKKMPAFKPRQEITQMITMVDQAIFQLEILTDKCEIMVIIESMDSENENVQVLDFIAESKFTTAMNYRKTVHLERESFYHKILSFESKDMLTLAFASKIDRWLKLNLIVYSDQPDSFNFSKILE